MAQAALDLLIRLKGGDAASKQMSGLAKMTEQVGSKLATFGKVAGGIALGGVVALGAGLAKTATAGLSFNNSIEQTTAKINAFTKDGAKTAGILDLIRERAAKTPFAFDEMARAASGLLPVVNATGKPLEDLISQAEVLAASNPMEGLEGAVYALKQAASGDMASIIDRFDLPRQRLNDLKAQGVPALEAVSVVMKELGYDTDLVTNLAATAQGRWSTFTDTLTTLASKMTEPIFNIFSEGLGTLQAKIDENMPLFESLASAVGDRLGGAVNWIINTGIPGLISAWGTIQAPLGIARDAILTFAAALTGNWEDDASKIEPIHRVFGNLGSLINETIMPAFTEVSDWFAGRGPATSGDFRNAVDSLINPFLNDLSSLIAGIRDSLPGYSTNMGGAATSTSDMLRSVAPAQSTLGQLIDLLKDVEWWLNATAQGFQDAGREVRAMAMLAGSDIGVLGDQITRFFERIPVQLTNLKNTWNRDWEALSSTVSRIWDTIITSIGNQLAKIPVAISNQIATAKTKAIELGSSVISGIIQGMTSMQAGAASAIAGIVMNIITSGRVAAKAKSPSQLADMQLGKPIGQGIIQGLVSTTPDALAAMRDLVTQLLNSLKSADLKIKPADLTFLNSFLDTVKGAADALKAFGGVGDLSSVALPMREQLQTVVASLRDTVADFWHGAQGVLYALKDDVAGDFADLGSKSIKALADAVKAFTDLALEDNVFRAPPREALQSVIRAMADAVADFWHEAQTVLYALKDETAGDFADLGSKSVKALADAFKVFSELQDARIVDIPAGAMEALARGLQRAVEIMKFLSDQFVAEAVAQTAVFAEGVGKIVSPLAAAAGLFKALQEVEGIPEERMRTLAGNIWQAIYWMQEITKGIEQEGLVAAATASVNISKIFDALKTGIDVIKGLMTIEAVPPERFESFKNNFLVALGMMVQLADMAGAMLFKANDWANTMKQVKNAMDAGTGVLESINKANREMGNGAGTLPTSQYMDLGRMALAGGYGVPATPGYDWPVLGGGGGMMGARTNAAGEPMQLVVQVDARGSTLTERQIQAAVDRGATAALEKAGYRGDIRKRT